MFGYYRRETAFLLRHMGLITGCAFISAMLGTMMWINGRGVWFVMHCTRLPECALPLSVLYCLWLAVYGISGAVFPLALLIETRIKSCLPPAVITLGISYVLALLWFPLFFSAQFVFPSLCILILSLCAISITIFKSFTKSLWLTTGCVVICCVELYFMIFTFQYFLLN